MRQTGASSLTKSTNTAESTIMKSLLAFSFLLLGMVFFGTGTPAAKVVTGAFPLFLAPFLRLLAAAVLTTPILIWYRHELRDISRASWFYILGIGAIGLVGFSLFLLTGMQMVSGVAGVMVMSLSPAAVALGAAWFLGGRLGWRKPDTSGRLCLRAGRHRHGVLGTLPL